MTHVFYANSKNLVLFLVARQLLAQGHSPFPSAAVADRSLNVTPFALNARSSLRQSYFDIIRLLDRCFIDLRQFAVETSVVLQRGIEQVYLAA